MMVTWQPSIKRSAALHASTLSTRNSIPNRSSARPSFPEIARCRTPFSPRAAATLDRRGEGCRRLGSRPRNPQSRPLPGRKESRNLAHGSGYGWGFLDDSAGLARVLWPVAFSAARLLEGADLEHLKSCGGCGRLFSMLPGTTPVAGATWRGVATAKNSGGGGRGSSLTSDPRAIAATLPELRDYFPGAAKGLGCQHVRAGEIDNGLHPVAVGRSDPADVSCQVELDPYPWLRRCDPHSEVVRRPIVYHEISGCLRSSR